MRRNFTLFLLLFIVGILKLHSQTNSDLIFNYYGFTINPYEELFIISNINDNSTLEDIEKLSLEFKNNETQILNDLDNNYWISYLVDKFKNKKKAQEKSDKLFSSIFNTTITTLGIIQEQKAIKAQENAERDARIQANLDRMKQNRVDNRPDSYKNAQTTSPYKFGSDISSSNNVRNGYSDLMTSDQGNNTAIRMSVETVGVTETRNAINERRAMNSNPQSTNVGIQEKTITAVTSSRQQIFIKIRGNVIVSYSNGLDQVGQQKWIPVVPEAQISKSGVGTAYDSSNLNREFGYTARISNMTIHFNL